tara:strand:+ start:96 stop:2363 length:2268 start_codon:yes stop_codon:yes gene_type:complete
MATDNIAGHTAAQNTLGEDGLRDGDSLSPTTLTNLIQGVHGNGILRYQDGAYGSSRNETNSGNQPGSMVRASASTLGVSGGFVVLDGALYEFANGVGDGVLLDLNNPSHGSGALTLAANQEAIYTIYVAPSGGVNKVAFEAGSPVDTTTGIYPSASNQYLIDYDGTTTQDNMKTIVLAHVRVQYIGSGGGSNNLNIVEINDKRVFLQGSADYRIPLSTGTISSGSGVSVAEIADGGSEGVNTIAHLNAIHNENGELAVTDTVNVHWVSHPRYGSFDQLPPGPGDAGYGQGPSRGADRGGGHVADSFYFAGRNNQQTGHYSVRLQGRGVDATSTALTTSGIWKITADGDSFFMLAPNNSVDITLQPEQDSAGNYMFPEGHTIEVCNNGLGNIIFDDLSGSNETIAPSHRATFIYEGSVWVRCDYQSAILGITPAIVDNSGTPDFATGITQGEVLTLLGIETGATADQTDAEIRAAVEAATDSNVFTDADHNKLNAIEANADVTDETNVKAAIDGMTLTDIGTPASTDRILIQDADDSNNLKYADFSEFGGSGGGSGTVTSIGTTAPITGGTITSTGTIGISAATTSAAGSMSAADKLKLDGIAAGANVYTNGDALSAVSGNDLFMDNERTFRASTCVVDFGQNPLGLFPNPTVYELIPDEAGTVILAPGGTTWGLPDPSPFSGTQVGDTYVIINIDTGAGAGTPVTIDRTGNPGGLGGHGTAQDLNGAATNGSLPAHEAVTIIYTGPVTGWYGIGL